MTTFRGAAFTLTLVTIALIACGGGPDLGAEQKSIGVATMDEEGTIVLTLRAEGEGGLIGDSQISYRPDDPHYQEVLEHLGGLKPGEEKAVPPWPDD